jgi:hypothetical protein
MPNHEDDGDPFTEAHRSGAEALDNQRRQHEALRASHEFKEQTRRLERSTLDFAHTLRTCALASTRDAALVENSFFLRIVDDLIQSALMAAFAIREGYLNPARRELRFLIELAVQAQFTDEQMGRSGFDARCEFFKRQVRHSSADDIRDLNLGLIKPKADDFKKHVVKVWATASNYVHPSVSQLRERFELAERGVSLGFETVNQLRGAVDEVAKVLGIGVVLCFHAVGAFAGDFIVGGIDAVDAWAFHSDPFVACVDESFDYKHERQARLADIRARRTRRLGAVS